MIAYMPIEADDGKKARFVMAFTDCVANEVDDAGVDTGNRVTAGIFGTVLVVCGGYYFQAHPAAMLQACKDAVNARERPPEYHI